MQEYDPPFMRITSGDYVAGKQEIYVLNLRSNHIDTISHDVFFL